MLCATCKTELSPAFKHAFEKNVCPACGGEIMDEESLALIEDISHTMTSAVTLRDETAQKLAMVLMARYDIGLRAEAATMPAVSARANVPARSTHKVAPPSAAQQISKTAGNVITAEEINAEGISDAEREAIMADAVSKRYGMMDQISAASIGDDDGLEGPDIDIDPNTSPFAEGADNPVLEKERLIRLQKQQAAMRSGSGAFRRSS